MAKVSDLILSYPEVQSFEELEMLVRHLAASGEVHLEFDLKPDYRDTPRRWEWALESAFTRGIKYD